MGQRLLFADILYLLIPDSPRFFSEVFMLCPQITLEADSPNSNACRLSGFITAFAFHAIHAIHAIHPIHTIHAIYASLAAPSTFSHSCRHLVRP